MTLPTITFLRRAARPTVDLELPLQRPGWRAELARLCHFDGEAAQAFTVGFALVLALAPGQADAQHQAPSVPPSATQAQVATVTPAAASAPASIQDALAASPALLAARRQIGAALAGRQVLREADIQWTAAPALTRRSAAGAGSTGGTDWELVLARPVRQAGRLAAAERVGEARLAQARQAWQLAWRGEARHLLDLGGAALRQCQAAEAARELAASFEQQARGVARRAELGDAAAVEALQARAALAQAEAQRELAQARCEAESARLAQDFPGLELAALTRSTGWSPATSSGAVSPALSGVGLAVGTSEAAAYGPSGAVSGAGANDEALLQAWLDAQPELAALRLERERLQAEQGLALAELRPAPTVGLKVGQNAGGEKVLGLQLGFSLGGAELRRATGREQAARLTVVDAELTGLERQLRAQARAALSQRRAAERSAADLARAAAQWQQSATALARGHALGEGSLAELLAARRLAGEQQAAAAQARVDAWQAGLQIALETGQLWPAAALPADEQAQ